MTITRLAYEKHEFIRTSIDLLCAGVSWSGGKFIMRSGDAKGINLPLIDTEFLEELARSLLLEGKAFIEVSQVDGKIVIVQNETPNLSMGGKLVTILRTEDSFSPRPTPILEHVGSNIELYEKAIQQLPINPSSVEIVDYTRQAIHSSLAIPSVMLDQTNFLKIPVETLMTGAIQYQSEVNMLRNTLSYGLDQVGDLISNILDIEAVIWEWSIDWIVRGLCKYGHVYQVFKSKGIILTPIRNSELGWMDSAVKTSLIPNRLYAECLQSYGNE